MNETAGSKVLRTGVVGLGRVGWKVHVPSTSRHQGFELVAVADTEESRRREAEDEYGARAYAALTDMLDKEDLDLLVVCTPTTFRVEHVTAALSRGIDVFLDKPMAPTAEDAGLILEAVDRDPTRQDDEVLGARGSVQLHALLDPVLEYELKGAHGGGVGRR